MFPFKTSRYDDVILDYRINFLILITFFVDVLLTSISLVVTNFMFCHRYDDINLVVSISPPFQIAVERKKKMSSRRVESGFQSGGHETQFVFSDGDIQESDVDPGSRPALGKSLFPLSIKLLRNILSTVRPFLFCIFTA